MSEDRSRRRWSEEMRSLLLAAAGDGVEYGEEASSTPDRTSGWRQALGSAPFLS